jgi:uncharacterized protein YbjT (DUF2867 family)
METLSFTAPRLRICVLGGTGFVGTELVSQLASAGHWVRVPTRQLSHGMHLNVLPTVELLAANIHEPRVLGELLAGMDVAINLVGILNEHRGARFREVHVELVAKLIDEARNARLKRLVHMSALGADEAQGPSSYLRTKGRAETLLRESHTDWTIFRPSVIFGPGDSLTTRFVELLRLAAGFMPLARARARFAPVFVEDVAAAFVRVLRDPASLGQTYELCGPEVLTLGELVRTSAAAAHIDCHILPLPGPLGWLQGLVLGMLPGSPFSLDNFRSLKLDSVCRENGLARLGIPPRPLASVLPIYLGDLAPEARLNRFRATIER